MHERSNAARDAELSAELESYVDLLTAEKMAAGMDESAARRSALMEFGGMEQVKENVRDVRRGARAAALLLDARHGARSLRRAPALACVIVLTLAITIGADTAIYSIAHALLLQKLPYANVDRVAFMEDPPVGMSITAGKPGFKLARSVREHPTVESSALFYPHGGANLEGPAAARIAVTQVTPSFMRTLGARPALGRDFTEQEGADGATPVILLSDALWRRLGAQRDIIGTTLRLSGVAYTVIGVMPTAVEYPIGTEAWMPVPLRMELMGSATGPSVIARVRAGVSLNAAGQQLNRAVREANPARAGDLEPLRMNALRAQLTEPIRLPVLLLLATVTVVLLIGCANVAALLLARIGARESEFIMRGVLGAGATRIVRQVACEALLLGVAGGVLGLLVARLTMQLVVRLLPADVLPIHSIHMSAAALGYSALISIACALLFGTAPALRAAHAGRTVPQAATTTVGRQHERFRATLVCSEIALGVLLVLCAGLLTRSLLRLERIPLGMDPANVITAQLRLPVARYADAASHLQYADRVLERVRALPGVDAAGLSSLSPFSREPGAAYPVERTDHPPQPHAEPLFAAHMTASPSYADALGMRIIHGRSFNERDGRDARVFIITEQLARELFGTARAAGRRISVPALNVAGEVIGVTAELRLRSVTAEAGAVLMEPMAQSPTRYMTLAVRTSVDEASMAAALRAAVHDIDPNVPAYDVRTMRDVVSTSMGTRSALPRVVGMFAAIAVLLCALGTYGLISEVVTRQRRALSIRMALGARPTELVTMVLRRSLRLAGIGTAIGLLAGVAATRLMTSVLFETDPLDPLTFAIAPLVIAVVTIVASAPPALRAARVQAAALLKE